MAIACVYCGGEHESSAQVRRCWETSEPGDRPRAPEPPGQGQPPGQGEPPGQGQPPRSAFPAGEAAPGQPAGTPTRRPRTQTAAAPFRPIPSGLAAAGPGPDRLGRHVMVAPGQAAPAPWQEAPRLVISATCVAEPAVAIARLRSAHQERERLVIEVQGDLDLEGAPASITADPPHTLGPRFTFEQDELIHLVRSNTVDFRDPAKPTWIGLDAAIHAGARPAGAGADVELPDGGLAWIDGGPIRHTEPIDEVPVLHAVVIEHGSFSVPHRNDSVADLAPDQLEAVTHDGGAARIIAPAGSGKTRVLTERARHLLTAWNLPPGAVSLVAFNKRAQEEMTERTGDLPQLQVRTLNAIGLAIVNGTPPFAPQPRRWNTIDELGVRRIIGDLVSFPRRRNADPVAPWIEALSLIRLGLVDPVEAETRYDGDVNGLAEMWPRYRAALERAGAVDFDDQIYRALLVLLTDPVARRAAQRACRVMLVDEFQDLTPAHLLLIRLLASPGGAVFGVGDDDQTIYGYNGADPAWLIDFAELFPGAGSHPLEVNYRCPAGIVDAVDRLLRHNRRRVPKTIRAASSDTGGWSVDRSADPVAAAGAAVTSALAAGAAPGEVAVLTRVNALLAPVQVELVRMGVPIAGGVGLEFVERTAVRTALAWIRLATGRAFRTEDLREGLRRPSRSFHPRIGDWIAEQRSLDDLHRLAARLNNDKDTDRLVEFAADIARLQEQAKAGASTAEIVRTLIDDIGLAGAVSTLDVHRRGMNRAAQGDDLTAVEHLAALHADPATFGSWLRDRLAVPRSSDGVVLSTVHRVKGQEWPYVVVHLADAEQYPHRLAEDVEEERRLFHVALTRASRFATVVTGSHPSPFVDELTTEPSTERDPVRLHRGPSAPSAGTTKTASNRTDPVAELDEAGQRLYAALGQLRNELRDGKPAYVVFDNKTAAAIAAAAPTTERALLRVPGIGPAKVDKYGAAILDLVRRHQP